MPRVMARGDRAGQVVRSAVLLALLWAIAGCWTAPSAASEQPAPAGLLASLPALEALEGKGARTAGLVVDLEHGRLLAARSPDQPLAPASVTKLVTASLALEIWGPGHRFATRLLRRGPLVNGVLHGDLVLRGSGDASLLSEDLWRMARSLAQLGLRRVEGRLLVDEGHFGQLGCGTLDRCEALLESEHAYDAPLTATPVDYNLVTLKVVAGAADGQAARLLVDPYPVPGVRLEGEVTTGLGRPEVRRATLDGQERLLVSGSLPAGSTMTFHRSLGEPARHAGELFSVFLSQAGVAIAGGVEVSAFPVADAEPLLEHRGAPLAESLRLMLGYSNNLLADSLALNLLLALRPQAAPDLSGAGDLLGDYLAAAAAGSAFQASQAAPAPRLLDGSGLEPANRLTARQVVQLLERLYRHPALFPALAGALNVPESAPQDSLRSGDPEPGHFWNQRLLVKSGGLSEPVSVTTLAGFFRFEDGGWGAFAFLVTGAPGSPVSRGDAFSAMRRDLTAHSRR